MKLKLDENLPQRLARPLTESGHDVCTVHAQGRTGVGDHALARHCAEDGWCLVTLDRGFANPLLFDPRGGPGLVVLRAAGPLTTSVLGALLATLAEALRDQNPLGRLWIVEVGRIRVHRRWDDDRLPDEAY